MNRILTILLILICITHSYGQRAGVPLTDSFLKQMIPAWRSIPVAQPQSVNDCNTWTYRVKFANGTPKIITGAISLPDGNFIVAGYDSLGQKGFIVKVNNQGNLLTAQEFSQYDKAVAFKKIKYFSDGNLYILAETTDLLTNITRPSIIVTDVNGNVIAFNDISVTGFPGSWQSVELDEWKDNSFSLLLTNDSLINVSRIQKNGTILWSRTWHTKNKPEGLGILNDFYDTYVTYNEIDSGFHKGVMLDISDAGNFRYGWKVGGNIDGTEYTMQSMRMINLRPRMTALQKKSGITSLIRLNCSPFAKPEVKEVFTGSFIANDQLRSAHSEWTEVIASANGTSSDLWLTFSYPDNYFSPISGRHLTYSNPVRLQTINRTLGGGSFITAVDAANDIVFTKVDSIGILPVCGSTAAAAAFTSEATASATETLPLLPGEAVLTVTSFNHTGYDGTWSEECKQLYCPVVAEPDTCLRTFFKEYRNNSHSMWVQQLQRSGDTLLLAGRMRETPYDAASERPTITMMDTLGRLIDARVFSDPLRIDFSKTIKTKDGNFLSSGYVYHRYDSLDQFLIKYTPQLTILWQKKLSSPDRFRNIADIIESQEGDLYCYIADALNSLTEKRHLMKLTATGNPVWYRSYSAGPNFFLGAGEYSAKITELGNYIYLKYNEESGDWSPHIIKISKTDGSVVWKKKYENPAMTTNFLVYLLASNDNHIYLFGRGVLGNVFMKIAEDGSVVSCKRSDGVSMSSATKKDNNRFLLSGGAYYFNNSSTTYGVLELDTGFQILRRQSLQVPRDGRIDDLVPFSDSVSFAAGSFFSSNPYWATFSFQKYNFNSSFGSCAVTDFQLNQQDFPINIVNESTAVASLTLPQETVTNGSFISIPAGYASYHCGKLPLCNNIDLTGPISICDSVNEYTYHVQRNAGCNGIVKWTIDTIPGRVKLIAITDTTIRFKAMASGIIRIRAALFASCEWLYDSLDVDLSISPAGVLNLGPDTVICPGNTILLNAHKGYTTYLWQDGSSDSTFTVTASGTYYVDVTTCGNTIRDSVVVNDHPPIAFDAGPDRVKCNGDTLHIQAPPGFLNYAWSNNYNINSVVSQQVVVAPLVDIAYFVRGEKTPGCFAYDTVRITVHHSLPVFLGNDTSFCTGSAVVLDAGNGFSSYLWNGGSSSQQLSVNAIGQYSVIVTTAEGCRSYDTLKVLNVFVNPVVSLVDKPSICTGSSVTFNAGNFTSYLWNNGSIAPTITVNAPGKYYVTVTDDHHCTGSDTTDILTLLPLPAGFLPIDTVICSYGKIEIKPSGIFNSYLWSSNHTGSFISVTQPGEYWLEVKDQNDCRGRDTIIVNPKECMKGFYIAGAFTPNNDGKNDDFKPLLFGQVKQYRFTIYNRWGERVFETNQLSKGWDGTLAGQKQDTYLFIWTCTYQFDGEAVEMKKGTVVLIR